MAEGKNEFKLTERVQGLKNDGTEVTSKFDKLSGGSVVTQIQKGDALLTQRFSFNSEGILEQVFVSKYLGKGIDQARVFNVELLRGSDGKFIETGSSRSPKLNEWNEKFYTKVNEQTEVK